MGGTGTLVVRWNPNSRNPRRNPNNWAGPYVHISKYKGSLFKVCGCIVPLIHYDVSRKAPRPIKHFHPPLTQGMIKKTFPTEVNQAHQLAVQELCSDWSKCRLEGDKRLNHPRYCIDEAGEVRANATQQRSRIEAVEVGNTESFNASGIDGMVDVYGTPDVQNDHVSR